MRAHGIGDESGNMDDEDPASDWEDKIGEGDCDHQVNKRMYALRSNPNRLKSCRICENCGKEFLSWKSFLEHGKCGSEDAESLLSSPESEGDDDDARQRSGCGGWSKRKRSIRAKVGSFSPICPSSEEEDLALAKCLMALSNARVDPCDVEPEESCASASRDEDRRHSMAAFLAPLDRPLPLDKAKGIAKGTFECKACKKVFNSHQALGGHRASHKKVKGCFAARNDQFEDSLADDDLITHDEFFPSKSTSSYQFDHGPSTTTLAGDLRKKSKVHKCSICHRIFASGQALGGHKRCHWLTSNSPEASSFAKYHQFHHDDMEHIHQRPVVPQFTESESLDLNLPAPREDIVRVRRDPRNPLSFEVSTEINLQSWVDVDGDTKEDKRHFHHLQNNCYKNSNNNKDDDGDNNDSIARVQNVDDEADSKVKLAKLSELKDMNITGTSSPWLQVGIGPATGGNPDP
ncbi:hypothetical protein RJ639_006652 [Escallonia herrerae]|uniref:C2H2-type domain-containing protein n=1 Tax=Escallonia herrerae TaxID=1293975 RepID=A0AA89ATZ1_9ASTE|nr:hypothetical protein RJ639_006652 [Escallonia herrerae]